MTNWRTAMREEEILSVARFKLGDTARRLAVLAESASDADLRATLLDLAEMLRSEQRAIEHRPEAERKMAPVSA